MSGSKRRLREDGFNLDLSYVTPQLIAFGLKLSSSRFFLALVLKAINLRFLGGLHTYQSELCYQLAS